MALTFGPEGPDYIFYHIPRTGGNFTRRVIGHLKHKGNSIFRKEHGHPHALPVCACLSGPDSVLVRPGWLAQRALPTALLLPAGLPAGDAGPAGHLLSVVAAPPHRAASLSSSPSRGQNRGRRRLVFPPPEA